MAQIDFSQPVTDVFGDEVPEAYTEAAVTDRSFTVCEKCGTGTPHHEIKQRPLTLGAVCVQSLLSSPRSPGVGPRGEPLPAPEVSDEDVLRDHELARRIVGPTKGTWATVEIDDPAQLTRLRDAVRQSPAGWAKSVRAAVIAALKC